jgi:hypothetical protein
MRPKMSFMTQVRSQVNKSAVMHNTVRQQAKRVGTLWNPTTPSHRLALKEAEAAGERLGVQLVLVQAQIADDFAGAFATLSRERATALLVIASPLAFSRASTETSAAGNGRDQVRGRGGQSYELRSRP